MSLLNDILDMSKLQSGKIDIQSEPYSIEAMLDDIWYMQSANMEKKGINFSISKDINWLWIIGTVTLQVSQKMLDGLHIFTVYRCEDSGIGMSPGFLKTIFDPFSQEQNANSDNTIKGSGLGMPICKELVEKDQFSQSAFLPELVNP